MDSTKKELYTSSSHIRSMKPGAKNAAGDHAAGDSAPPTGASDGTRVGRVVGLAEGRGVGLSDGSADGLIDGWTEGIFVGEADGFSDGV